MKEPGHHTYNRAWVEELPAQVLLHEPGRRDEVVGLYKDLLEFLLTTEQEGVVDSDFITGLAVPVTMTQAPELLPAIRELYHRGLIEDSMQGNLEEIERAFADGADAFEIMALLETPFEFYSLAYRERQRELISAEGLLAPTEPTAADLILTRRREEEAARRQRLLERKLAPTKATKKKVGRNDPCPCGSGRKYKQCCLKRGI